MAEETGRTVRATLKLIIDDADAKRQRKAIEKDFDEITKKATLSDWRKRNQVEVSRDRAEVQKQRKQEHAEEMAHQRSLGLMVRTGRKEQHEFEMAKRRSLSLMVREGQRTAREAEQEQRRMEGAQGRAGLQTLAMLGAGGVAHRIGQAQTYGGALTAAGYGRLGGAISGNAGAIGVGYAAGEKLYSGLKAGARAEISPFANTAQRGSMALQEMLPATYDAYTLFSGMQREQAQGNYFADQQNLRNVGSARAFSTGMDWRATSDTHHFRGEAYKNYQVAGLPTADRTTALGAVQYGEQERRMPFLQAEKKAEVELHAARMNSMQSTKRAKDAEQEYNRVRTKSDMLFRNAQGIAGGVGTGPTDNRIKTQMLRESGDLQTNTLPILDAAWQKALREEQANKAAVVNAEQGVRSARIATSRVDFENLQAREQHATGQATALGGMGPAGRLRGELALQMLSENGIEFMSPEMISAAESVAPLTVQKMKQGLGEAYGSKSAILSKYAPEDYKEYGMGPELRERVDAERGKLAEAGVSAEKQTAMDMAKAFGIEFAGVLMNAIMVSTKTQIDNLKVQGQLQVQSGVAGGSK